MLAGPILLGGGAGRMQSAPSWRRSGRAGLRAVIGGSPAPVVERYAGRFADLIGAEPDPRRIAALRAAETIGRPLGSESFLGRIAALTGRDARPRKRGPKRRGFSKVSPKSKYPVRSAAGHSTYDASRRKEEEAFNIKIC